MARCKARHFFVPYLTKIYAKEKFFTQKGIKFSHKEKRRKEHNALYLSFFVPLWLKKIITSLYNLSLQLSLLVVKQPHSDRRTIDTSMPKDAATRPTHPL